MIRINQTAKSAREIVLELLVYQDKGADEKYIKEYLKEDNAAISDAELHILLSALIDEGLLFLRKSAKRVLYDITQKGIDVLGEYQKSSEYTGEVNDDGVPHGTGVIYHADGSRYEGGFNNGCCEGKGILHYVSGDRFEAVWDTAHRGKGVYIYADGKTESREYIYGEWVRG
jgi:predicted transcriptional regulator